MRTDPRQMLGGRVLKNVRDRHILITHVIMLFQQQHVNFISVDSNSDDQFQVLSVSF